MKSLLKFLIKLVLVLCVTALLIFLIYSNFFKEYYYLDRGYMRSLGDINKVYKEESKVTRLKTDIISLDFVQTGDNRYERAYNARLCEVFTINDDEYVYMVTDSCYSVMSEKIVLDFDNDEKRVLYYLSSNSDVAYYRETTKENVGFVEYNFSTKEYSHSGHKIDKLKMDSFNRSFRILMDEFNARVF